MIQANGTLAPGHVGQPRVGVRPTPASAQAAYDQLAGLSAAKARAKVVELLAASGDLVGEPRPITHHVKFYEKGDRPLEIVTSRQWFIKTIEYREALLARGRELQWHPPYMRRALRELGERPERRLVRQPAALLRRAVPGVVSACAHDGSVDHGAPLLPTKRACRSIRRPTCRTAS